MYKPAPDGAVLVVGADGLLAEPKVLKGGLLELKRPDPDGLADVLWRALA